MVFSDGFTRMSPCVYQDSGGGRTAGQTVFVARQTPALPPTNFVVAMGKVLNATHLIIRNYCTLFAHVKDRLSLWLLPFYLCGF